MKKIIGSIFIIMSFFKNTSAQLKYVSEFNIDKYSKNKESYEIMDVFLYSNKIYISDTEKNIIFFNLNDKKDSLDKNRTLEIKKNKYPPKGFIIQEKGFYFFSDNKLFYTNSIGNTIKIIQEKEFLLSILPYDKKLIFAITENKLFTISEVKKLDSTNFQKKFNPNLMCCYFNDEIRIYTPEKIRLDNYFILKYNLKTYPKVKNFTLQYINKNYLYWFNDYEPHRFLKTDTAGKIILNKLLDKNILNYNNIWSKDIDEGSSLDPRQYLRFTTNSQKDMYLVFKTTDYKVKIYKVEL